VSKVLGVPNKYSSGWEGQQTEERIVNVRKTLVFLLAASFVIVMTACEDESDDNGVAPDDGFIASDGDFAGYDDWDRVDFVIAPVNQAELGGFAHGATDPSVVRDVYSSDMDAFSGGEWDQGTMLVKETHGFVGTDPDVANATLLAMAKRGSDFDAEADGWEFFMMTTDATIANRSGLNREAFEGCIGCHASADNDYVFSHPSSYELSFDTDQEYIDFITDAVDNWEALETVEGPDPLLGEAHGGGDPFRTIYRWQEGAVYKDGAFPTGTVLAKRVWLDDGMGGVTEPEGAWTAMVKKDEDTWQWLRLDTVNGVVMVNTDSDNAGAGCTGCHAAATGANGGDWAFLHPGLGN
jgi:Cytochrome P460